VGDGKEVRMSSIVKCKRCGRPIVRNPRGEWALPHSKLPSTTCRDGKPHEPDGKQGGDGSGIVTAVAVGTSIVDAGVI
jgi:hypothetical protein